MRRPVCTMSGLTCSAKVQLPLNEDLEMTFPDPTSHKASFTKFLEDDLGASGLHLQAALSPTGAFSCLLHLFDKFNLHVQGIPLTHWLLVFIRSHVPLQYVCTYCIMLSDPDCSCFCSTDLGTARSKREKCVLSSMCLCRDRCRF